MDIHTQAILAGLALIVVGFGVFAYLYASSQPRDLPPRPPGEKKPKAPKPLSLDGARKKRKRKAA